ncbi:glucose 1-dehydrogenase [Natronosporangium hydrolyticum]|uniref:Glucose 1-dehydrogenase n=1 Tax=Natronosporangium hydrolyticum TaxID=2811111 RepID=A0A895YJQ4_9ACTN|nr:glucose 1-dehydrogenase [Natronosporangium hydrolyticum]QSB16262.1 glucose 1-dehydrogenase [Natronosporangium hydrolyticum]
MKAIAVSPKKIDSSRLIELPRPSVTDVPDGRGVLVRMLRVGLDGTDREIDSGDYGEPPPGEDMLVTGHESFGRVVEVGPAVTELTPDEYVVALVRRAGHSRYDLVDLFDLTTDDSFQEHGISRVHGFLTEYLVAEPRYLVRVPSPLAHVGVLLEPASVVAKGLMQAYDVQRRLRVWQPQRAAVFGAGAIGLLAALLLRIRGLSVTVFALEPPGSTQARLARALGAEYVSTAGAPGPAATPAAYDLIFEATGYAPVVFDAMTALAKNGILMLASVTNGDRRVEVPVDALNRDFVLGNKAMVGTVNANREHFEAAIRDLAVAELEYPGWLSRLLTHRVEGLDRYPEALTALAAPDAIKVYVEVAPG